ncbi:hypothetical protein [Mumia xiangluensis]|uniref:Sulfotransferase family protein n=1 Tax=Mumia xiangluensis TaxID=1678900 RepID=A0ABW1QG32_9ACTN
MSDADGLLLPEGTRLVHIGPHKTGTTAVQRAFHLNRDATAEHGVVYAGRGLQPYAEVRSLMPGAGRLGSRHGSVRTWERLVASIDAAGDDRVVLSCESLDGASVDTAARVRDDLGADRVHVVRMVRRFDRLLPSSWQQSLTNGRQQSYLRWIGDVLSKPDHNFWERQNYTDLTMKWAEVVGPENVTVVVVDETDRRWLLDVFEDMTGLPRGTLKAGDSPDNLSLSPGGAAAIRRVNRIARQRRWAAETHLRLIRNSAVRGLKLPAPAAGTPKLMIPERWVDAVVEASNRNVEALESLPVRVIGDPSTLRLDAGTVRSLPDDQLRERFATSSPRSVANGVAAVAERARKGPAKPIVADPDGDPASLRHLRLTRNDDPGVGETARLIAQRARRRGRRRTPDAGAGATTSRVDPPVVDRAARGGVVLTLGAPELAASRGWQRHVEAGGVDTYDDWLAGRSSADPTSEGHHEGRHVRPELRYEAVVLDAIEAAGAEQVTVVVADAPAPGRDLTLVELEIVRELNRIAGTAGWSAEERARFVVGGVVEPLRARRPAPGERPVALPGWAHPEIAASSRAAVDVLRERGVTVVGRVESLLAAAPAAPGPEAAPEVSAGLAAAALVGAIEAAGVPEIDDARRQAWRAREDDAVPSVRDLVSRLAGRRDRRSPAR